MAKADSVVVEIGLDVQKFQNDTRRAEGVFDRTARKLGAQAAGITKNVQTLARGFILGGAVTAGMGGGDGFHPWTQGRCRRHDGCP